MSDPVDDLDLLVEDLSDGSGFIRARARQRLREMLAQAHRPQRAEVERLAKVYAVYRDLYVHSQVPIENKQHEDAMQELLDYTCGPPGIPEGQP